jgi:hypothetical protein
LPRSASIFVAARSLGLLCAVLSAALLLRLMASAPGIARLGAGLLCAASAPVAWWALAGMDAPLFALMVLCCAKTAHAMLQGGRALWCGLAASACAWTRPEGAAVAGVVLLAATLLAPRALRRRLQPAWLMFALAAGALFAFRLVESHES